MVTTYARQMVQTNKAVQRWKNNSWVESRRTLGTEKLEPNQILQERDSGGAPPPCHLECHHGEIAPAPVVDQHMLPAALVQLPPRGGLAWPPTPRHARPVDAGRLWCKWRPACPLQLENHGR